MRAFVTGATGFVGSHLVDALHARGDTVTCLVRNPAKARRLFPEQTVDIVQGDLSNTAALSEGCANTDTIYHLAGATSARSREEFFRVNAKGTERLCAAAASAAPTLERFVYVSSQAAAGPSKRGDVATEDHPPNPVSSYGASKLAGEDAVKALRLPWTIVRPTSVYGPRDKEFLPLFKVAKTGFVPLFGSGEQELSLIHARDLVAALLSVVTPDTASRTFFACHSEVVTSRTLAESVHRAVQPARKLTTSKPHIVTIPAWATRVALSAIGTASRVVGRTTLLNRDKANELLAEAWTCSPIALERATGWKARLALNAGLHDTAQWYRDHQWL